MKAFICIVTVLTLSASFQLAFVSAGCAGEYADCTGDADPCQLARCQDGYNCRVDSCGGCKAVCEPAGMVHIMSMPEQPTEQEEVPPEDPVLVRRDDAAIPAPRGTNTGSAAPNSASCPPGVATVNCLVDPCSTKKCSSNETCVSNYCGGCNAVCKANTVKTVPVKTPQASNNGASSCPPGVATVKCLVDPCSTKNCSKSEVCVSNYCGGCNAVCKANTTSPTAAKPLTVKVVRPANSTDSKPSGCPPGVSTVLCLVDPCKFHNCSSGEVCESNYCGACNAVCKPKPTAGPTASCPYAPCIATTCAANSKCEDDWATCSGKCIPITAAGGNTTTTGASCKVKPCSTMRCGSATYKSVCVDDLATCTGKCVEVPPPKCKVGQGFNTVVKACLPCRPGTITDKNKNECVPCPVNTYYVSLPASKKCVQCPEGKSTKGKTGQLLCL